MERDRVVHEAKIVYGPYMDLLYCLLLFVDDSFQNSQSIQ